MTDAEKLEYLRMSIEHNGIYRCKPGECIPGKAPASAYTWQFYLRRCLFDPLFVFTAAELLIKGLKDTDVQIGACEDAGVPLGLAMSMVLGRPMISIKKSRKAYGLANFTEGQVIGRPVVLVDDLAGSQTTLQQARTTLRAFNIPIAGEYAVLVDKTKATHQTYLRDMALLTLFTCEDFALTWDEYENAYGQPPVFDSY